MFRTILSAFLCIFLVSAVLSQDPVEYVYDKKVDLKMMGKTEIFNKSCRWIEYELQNHQMQFFPVSMDERNGEIIFSILSSAVAGKHRIAARIQIDIAENSASFFTGSGSISVTESSGKERGQIYTSDVRDITKVLDALVSSYDNYMHDKQIKSVW